MRRVIIGTFSVMLGTILLMDSLPGITGYVISKSSGFSLLSAFGFVLLACGLALFILEVRANNKNQKNSEKKK